MFTPSESGAGRNGGSAWAGRNGSWWSRHSHVSVCWAPRRFRTRPLSHETVDDDPTTTSATGSDSHQLTPRS